MSSMKWQWEEATDWQSHCSNLEFSVGVQAETLISEMKAIVMLKATGL